uniref:TIL domain-containing protein n=1 Tax=Caenorhabditis tropicalis TaxID=1561998 RepID=A0A1I7UKC5_9PELO
MMKLIVLAVVFIAVCTATKTCEENEELVACHNTCEPQCGFIPKACTEQCIQDTCDCKDGFRRNTLGKCVENYECTPETTKCPKNETFYGCGSACEPTCKNPAPKGCTKQCLVNLCQCTRGFVRHNTECIAKEDCPK